MKKPIDPNLDNILDDILASESKASESVLPKKEQISEEIKNEIEETLNSSDEGENIDFSFGENVPTTEKKENAAQNRILKLLRKVKVKFIVRRTAHQANIIIHQASIITPRTIIAAVASFPFFKSFFTPPSSQEKNEYSGKNRNFGTCNNFSSNPCIRRHNCFSESSGKNELKNVPDQTNYQETIEYNGNKYVYNSDVIAIAFMGVDKRDLGLDNGSVGTGGQSDADILLTINTKTGKAKAIAIPRDTMVDVDLYSESGIFLRSEKMQLCLSYAYGDK